MRLISGPTDLLRLPAHAVEAVGELLALVPRIVDAVGQAEVLIGRVDGVVDRADAAVTHVETTRQRADGVVAHTEPVVNRAAGLVNRLVPVVDRLLPLLDRLLPVLDKLEPMVARLADTTSPTEVDAVVKLIGTLPDISDKMRQDILPVLDTLGTVAPDLRDLLDVSRELNEMLGALPGLGRVKRKIEERQEAEDTTEAHRADEVPQAAPDRG